MDCCASQRLLFRKRQVLLNPVKFALQHSSSQGVKLAAVGSWARLMLLLLGQRQLLPLLEGPGAGAADIQQQQGVCEGLSVQTLQSMLQPMVDMIMGCVADTVPAAAAAVGASGEAKPAAASGRSKAATAGSCLAATPVVQFVLQQALQAAQAAAAAAAAAALEPTSAAEQSPGVPVLLCRLLQRAVCHSADAVAILAAAAACAGAGAKHDAAAATCTTPGSAAAAAARVTPEPTGGQAGRHMTPPPCTPVHGRVAGAPGVWASALKPGLDWGSGLKQGRGWLQLVTPKNGGKTPSAAAAAAAAVERQTPGAAAAVGQGYREATPDSSPDAAAAAAAAATEAADPVRVLRNLPGWLQLLSQTVQLLRLPTDTKPELQPDDTAAAGGKEGREDQQLQLMVREWLPAWCGAMQQMGAAVLLLQQQQQQLVGAEVDGRNGSSRQPVVQQQLARQAAAATVQCLWAVQEHLKVGMQHGRRGHAAALVTEGGKRRRA
jgi:hypothetical protein